MMKILFICVVLVTVNGEFKSSLSASGSADVVQLTLSIINTSDTIM